MLKTLPRLQKYELMKSGLFAFVALYGIVVTAVLIKTDLNPIVIGIDPYGTRVISGDQDPILKKEKETFLKQFIKYLYNYDETNFDDRISQTGDFMDEKLWSDKKSEFLNVSKRLKLEPLTQKGQILDIREIDQTHYEADLRLEILSRLKRTELKLRLVLELTPAERTSLRAYPWEVVNYEEHISNL